MTEHWIDVTEVGSDYEVHFDAVSGQYRHRSVTRLLVHPSEPEFAFGGFGAWKPGKPPADASE